MHIIKLIQIHQSTCSWNTVGTLQHPKQKAYNSAIILLKKWHNKFWLPTPKLLVASSITIYSSSLFNYTLNVILCVCVCVCVWVMGIYIYDLVPKGAHARGYALQLKIKHCWKLFLFEMLCCLLVWMNEYIVQIISATRLWLISRYSHHTLKKRRKMTAKNGHPCTEWFSSLCLQTNQKHMEKQSLICTRKTSFYMDNITSTLTIVVFSINWSRMFALYVRQMCCKLELKTLNNRKTTASLRNQRKRRVCSDPCICSTQRYSFFSSDVLRQIWRIFPRSFDIVVISDVPTR